MGWADPDRWKYRRRIGVPEKPLPEGTASKVDVGSLKLRSPNYHFTELDGVTPLSVDSVVEVGDDGMVLWVKQSAESDKGFYIYYDESIPHHVGRSSEEAS